MKWFDKWFFRKCKEAWEDAQYPDESMRTDVHVAKMRGRGFNIATASPRAECEDIQTTSTTFKLYQASGGTVIELRRYNDNTDRWENALHVIPSGEEFGKAIEHIITYEALKR